ncbi:MAG: hypothetical protein V1644_01295 [Candidatus Micrarchaeota archaeon]
MILPFILPLNVNAFKFVIEIVLAIIMFFSIKSFFVHKFVLEKNVKPIITSIFFSYILLPAILLSLAFLLLKSDALLVGYVLIAIVPPAISIIPLCYLSKCNLQVADASIFVSYLLSLVIIPVTLLALYGKTVEFMLIVRVLLVLIILPTAISYIFRKSQAAIFNYSKAIVNLCMGILILISIQLNRDSFLNFSNPEMLYVYLINFLAIFVTGFLVYHLTKQNSGIKNAVNYMLYATQKNTGTAITIALTFFSPVVAIPAIIILVLQFLYFIVFEKIIIKLDHEVMPFKAKSSKQ